MLEQLERILATPNLNKGLKEVAGRAAALAEKPAASATVESFDKVAKKAGKPANDPAKAKKKDKKGPANK